MSRAEQIVQELDRLAPGLLDYTVMLDLLQRQPTKLEVQRLNDLVPARYAYRIQLLLNKYHEVVEEPDDEDRWFIAYRLAKTDEERMVLDRLQETEKALNTLEELHTRIVDLEEALSASSWPPSAAMRSLLKEPHDAIHAKLDALKERAEQLQRDLLEYTKLVYAPTVGDA